MNADLISKYWDVIVIGAGLGGGTIGRRLAERGLSVLFVENGPFGPRAEQHTLRYDVFDPAARRVRGYEPRQMHVTIDGESSSYFAPIGSGVGGSSAFYAGTLERPERHDLDDSAARPHPTGGWPVGYDAFLPYFQEAEYRFHVCGENDPLSREPAADLLPPPPMGEGDRAMTNKFRRLGLHPYHVHLGVRFLPGCQMCYGRKCPRRCKMDGRSAGVEPALETGNAAVIDMCQARAIRGADNEITHIEAQRDGILLKLRARRYVLAAGALGSPHLLLSSVSENWPRGCANSSGLVGRNLMLHLSELIAIWPERGTKFDGPTKTISMRDIYYSDGQRFGAVAAFGIDASYGEIVHQLRNRLDRSAFRNIRLLKELARIPAFLAAKLLGNAKLFAGQLEDLAYRENCVYPLPSDPEQIRVEYTVKEELRQRRRAYRQLIKKKLHGHRSMFLNDDPWWNIPHACGTLRFGKDRKSSVLDRYCRSHDIRNLYVADASFMPTSLGINPGLTVAANALRVADRLYDQMYEGASMPVLEDYNN
ncbi:MAG: GMC family oxidoreductase [Hyphomicrobiales bacterium]|nr:GMC family oxidoreductase [Hyphomicrobiales bacterium]